MQAIVIRQSGGPDVMRLEHLEAPIPTAGEVLLQVKAAGVNFIDIYVRQGQHAQPLPLTPGQEASGIVLQVGEGVTSVSKGDRVAWCSVLGTYAQLALAPEKSLVPIPDGISFEQAAAGLLQGMTAHYLSRSAYPITRGDEVLVHAGAGGTGLLLTQMAKSLGARVFTTVSTPAKAELSYAAGADQVILYEQSDFADEVRRLTDGQGVAAVYDAVGLTTFERSLGCLKPRGSAVLFGSASGAVPPLDLMRLASMGSLHVTRPVLRDYVLTRPELLWRANAVFDAIATGELSLRIEQLFALADAPQAHRALDGRATTGKLVLTP